MPRDLRRILIPLISVLVAAMVMACAPLRSASAAPGIASPAPTGSGAAQRPDATLSIVQPPAGGTVPAGTVTVVVDYTGPALVAAAAATELNQYHLHYFHDVDPTVFVQLSMPIPLGSPNIVHTAALQVNFDNVAPGTHQIAVVLTGSNHISVNPPVVAQQTSFTVI
ncbi:MAG: hypothetical protein E6I52_03585 [Chloroflexi bacterium]|nr:MAG: hypothetical protein E6I52_03585 [Chloroflexota bacterium]